MARRWDDAVGRLLLRWAVLLHRTVAGRRVRERNIARRNGAIREAHRRGIPVEVLAERLGLTPSWIRQKIAEGKPPAVEEAA